MSNCISCGRELPAFSSAEWSEKCDSCRTAELAAAPAAQRVRVAIPTAWLTRILVGVNAVVFAAMVLRSASLVTFPPDALLSWGANWGPLSLDGQPWRILVSNYLHGGIVHILLNMWCLWNLGQLAEFVFGRWTTFLVYSLCGVAGSVASLWWHPLVVGVGASGAIFGLAGALIAAIYLGKLPYGKAGFRGVFKSLLAFAGYNLLFGAAIPGIDNSAHIGGLLMGLALGAVLGQVLIHPRDSRKQLETMVFGAALLVQFAALSYVKTRNSYVVPLGQAVEQLRQGQTEAAIATLTEACRRYPENAALPRALGGIYQARGMEAEAQAAFQRADELSGKR
jgi:rhomboid protease GluP